MCAVDTGDDLTPTASACAAAGKLQRLRCASVPVAQNKLVVPRSAVSMPCMPIRDIPVQPATGTAEQKNSPPSTRPSSPSESTTSSNLTSECSGWVSSGDTSSSEQRRVKLSSEQLRQKLAKITAVPAARKPDKNVCFLNFQSCVLIHWR